MDNKKIVAKLVREAGQLEYLYMKRDDRALWIRISTIPSEYLPLKSAIKSSKEIEKAIKAHIKSINKAVGDLVSSVPNEILISSINNKAYVSQTCLLGVRGLDDADKLYTYVKNNFDLGNF